MQYYVYVMKDKKIKINLKPAVELSKSKQISFYSGDSFLIEESVGYLLKHAQLALHRTVDGKMAGLDLTAMQWAPLMLIAHGKANTAAELSRCSGVETSTITRMLDRLETKGLLIRKRSETDRRIIYLELSDAGKVLVSKVPNLLAHSLNLHLRGFDIQELDALKSMLRRIIQNTES